LQNWLPSELIAHFHSADQVWHAVDSKGKKQRLVLLVVSQGLYLNRRKSSRAELSQNRWHTRYPVSEKSF
jgi:hypothetical protein